jgi:3-mercaptopyruvate sulfurtransferase SseA
MARLLTDKGYREVWPLEGGFDAWQELGYPVEAVVPEQAGLTSLEPASPTA